jgi:diacylglycerol kinase family enzyme
MCLYLKKSLKMLFSRTSNLIAIKLDTNHPRIKGIQVCTNKGLSPLQREIIAKDAKIGSGHLILFILRITGPEKLTFT